MSERKCPKCLAGYSKEDIVGSCTCDNPRINNMPSDFIGGSEHEV